MDPTARRPSGLAGSSPWHGLDPLTRLVVAVGTIVAAILLDGVPCLLLLTGLTVVAPAIVAGELRPVLRSAVLLSLPLALSAVAVNVLFSPGTLADGALLAVTVVARVVTMAGAAVLFYRTTRPGQLLASLQHHGVPAVGSPGTELEFAL